MYSLCPFISHICFTNVNFRQYKKANFPTFPPLKVLSWSRNELFCEGKVVSDLKKLGSKFFFPKQTETGTICELKMTDFQNFYPKLAP